MRVDHILHDKGSFVATVDPSASLLEVTCALAAHDVGALVVSRDGASIDGIVSERDLARAVAQRGAAALVEPVTTAMSTDVRTCRADDTVDSLAATMTAQRVRHLPVVDGAGLLAGIVSIGDVVKHRLGELETENGTLHAYLHSGR
ncbi:MAG: CBS domain-containing protein [Acidimicrobiales bacterium]